MEYEDFFRCFYEAEESELFNVSDLFYLVKNNRLVEFSISENDKLFIRQWKGFKMDYDDWDYKCKLEYWTLYLTDWTKIYDRWYGWWEDELKEWIEQCQRRERVL